MTWHHHNCSDIPLYYYITEIHLYPYIVCIFHLIYIEGRCERKQNSTTSCAMCWFDWDKAVGFCIQQTSLTVLYCTRCGPSSITRSICNAACKQVTDLQIEMPVAYITNRGARSGKTRCLFCNLKCKNSIVVKCLKVIVLPWGAQEFCDY